MATRQQFQDMQVHGHLSSTSGIDANGQKITGVATGTAPTDAVNVSQLSGSDEVWIGPGMPPNSQDLWVDTDEPSLMDILLQEIESLRERVARLEARQA